jgi:hypothetical protein
LPSHHLFAPAGGIAAAAALPAVPRSATFTVKGHSFARMTADSKFLKIEQFNNLDVYLVIFLLICKAEGTAPAIAVLCNSL